jgi:alkaline phosphatase D
MKNARRPGNPLLLLAALVLSACGLADLGSSSGENGGSAAQTTVTFAQGVAAGDVTDTSAILWTRALNAKNLAIRVSTDTQARDGFDVDDLATSEDADFTVKATVTGLLPATQYYYMFHSGKFQSPIGAFKTAPAADADVDTQFVVACDSDGSASLNQFEVLDRALAESPDFFIYNSDTAYMDTTAPIATDLPSMRAKYQINYGYPALRNLLGAVSTYWNWGDHNIKGGWNATTRATAPDLVAAGVQAFQEYSAVPQADANLGFYRKIRWGKNIEMFILDEHMFRSAAVEPTCHKDLAPTLPGAYRQGVFHLPASPPAGCLQALFDPSRTMLGATQLAQFEQDLAASDATWKVIVNDVPMSELFVDPYDRWEGYHAERDALLAYIRGAGITNVVMLTGDLHANVIGSARVSLFLDPAPVFKEIISGPIAARTQLAILADRVGGSLPLAAQVATFLFHLTQADCATISSLNSYGYGVLRVDAATHHLAIQLKDASGTLLCTSNLAPQ